MGAYSLSGQAQDGSEVTVTENTYGDWVVRCQQTNDAEKACVMTQQAMYEEGQLLTQVTVIIIPEQEFPLMTIMATFRCVSFGWR